MSSDKTSADIENKNTTMSVSNATEDSPNGFVRFMRKIYRPLGFQKGYNFPLFVIFAGAMFGFVLARFEYLNFDGIYATNAMPGDWFYFHSGSYRIGLILHLATVLPAGLIAVFQFVPVIRYKFLLYHRIAGYVAILLVITSNASVLVIARHSAGGDLSSQAWVGTSVIITYIGLFMAYFNIKKKQIDQHRAWMLRTWFYMGTIITLRIIMIISALITSSIGSYYFVQSCDQIRFTLGGSLEAVRALYPMCFDTNGTVQDQVAAHVDFNSENPIEIGSALHLSFGMAGWLALLLHAVGIEIYLKLTPRESERLRVVSYEKQLEAGYKNPGSAGLVLEKFGDAEPWVPKE